MTKVEQGKISADFTVKSTRLFSYFTLSMQWFWLVFSVFRVVGDEACASGTCPDVGPALEFAHMWTTPFMTVRPNFANKQFNQGLSARATQSFEAFKQQAAHLAADSNQFMTISEKFFQWQRDNFNSLVREFLSSIFCFVSLVSRRLPAPLIRPS